MGSLKPRRQRREHLYEAAGWWFRCESYAIRDGYIVPSSPEAQRYAIWEGYERCVGTDKPTAYHELIAIADAVRELPWFQPQRDHEELDGLDVSEDLASLLADKIDFSPAAFTVGNVEQGSSGYELRVGGDFYQIRTARRARRLRTASEELNERIVKWCRKYGPLGVLHVEVERITLVPRWYDPAKIGLSPELLAEHDGPKGAVLAQRAWRRFGGDSYLTIAPAREAVDESKTRLVTSRPEAVGELAAPEDWRQWEHRWRPHGLKWARREDAEPIFDPSLSSLHRFFRGVPLLETETRDYPLPHDRAFACEYVESVEDFLKYADQLRGFRDVLAQYRNVAALPAGKERDDSLGALDLLRERMQTVLNQACPVPHVYEDGRTRLRWQSPSLFGALVMMMLWDAHERRSGRRCGACGGLFYSNHSKARWCSSQCKLRGQKRAQRAKAQTKQT